MLPFIWNVGQLLEPIFVFGTPLGPRFQGRASFHTKFSFSRWVTMLCPRQARVNHILCSLVCPDIRGIILSYIANCRLEVEAKEPGENRIDLRVLVFINENLSYCGLFMECVRKSSVPWPRVRAISVTRRFHHPFSPVRMCCIRDCPNARMFFSLL